ncbi:MAG: hypothetical protein WED01_11515 [Candidatus Rokuibacteriota bacterium]
MSGPKALWLRVPRRGWLVVGALAMAIVGVGIALRFDRPSAAEEARPAAADEAKPAVADEAEPPAPDEPKPAAAAPKRQTPAEADAALEALFKGRGRSLADAPKFVVLPRKDSLAKYPCTKCHDNSFVDRRVRPLVEEHRDLVFEHGGGRFWCYESCHSERNIDSLVSLRGRPVDYDESYKVCGQCHSQREKDWHFGGHGKRAGAWNVASDIPLTAAELLVTERERIGTWRDERTRLNCTGCHDAHSPSFKPMKPSAPPSVRPGIAPASPTRHVEPKVWEHNRIERKVR